jgi:hypothetical protein
MGQMSELRRKWALRRRWELADLGPLLIGVGLGLFVWSMLATFNHWPLNWAQDLLVMPGPGCVLALGAALFSGIRRK